MRKYDYGEILFLGKCNNNCYYCLGNEMPKAKIVSNLNTPYDKLNNLDLFLKKLKENKCNIIYLSSTTTDPLLYLDIERLCDYLISKGFKLGIRTNGLSNKFINLIPKLDAEISLSINSLVGCINKEICNNTIIPDVDNIFKELSKYNKKCRVSIVVNRYNMGEISLMLDYLNTYNCISYIQLRKIYKYCNSNDNYSDTTAFNIIKNWLNQKYGNLKTNFHESIGYNTKIPIFLWEDVFKKSSLNTLNYFSDGKITGNNLLIEGYEYN